jgi:hypothetical protein
MVAFHQDGEHQSGVIGPRGLPKSVIGTTRTSRSPLDMSVHGGEAVIPTSRSK